MSGSTSLGYRRHRPLGGLAWRSRGSPHECETTHGQEAMTTLLTPYSPRERDDQDEPDESREEEDDQDEPDE